MNIYIASSWKNQHAVEMLTELLRNIGHNVLSFVENNLWNGHGAEKPVCFEEWVNTDHADKSFRFDTNGATQSDLVVYVGPSGTDAWAEVGAAWASGVEVVGLWSKGEPAGLMRRMVRWLSNYNDILSYVELCAYERRCRVCGCTDDNCAECIEVQNGIPCSWVSWNLCSRCFYESRLSA